MKKILNKLKGVLALGLLVGVLSGAGVAVVGTSPVQAQDREALCNGVNITGGEDGGSDGCSGEGYSQEGGGQGTISGLVKNILNIFSFVVGAISVIMIIVGGFKYITSGGDSTAVGSAKNTILYALVGLVIVIFAQVIVKYVIGSLTKQT